MTNTVVKFKRSGVVGKVPTTADLDYGELAINYADGVIYYKNAENQITSFSTGSSSGSGSTLSTARTVSEFTASAAQTSFIPLGGYTPGAIDVILNGSQLSSSDFTATNGTIVVLAQACTQGDTIRLVSYTTASLIDSYQKAEVDSLVNEAAIVMAIALG